MAGIDRVPAAPPTLLDATSTIGGSLGRTVHGGFGGVHRFSLTAPVAYLTENCCQGDASSCGVGVCDSSTLINVKERKPRQ